MNSLSASSSFGRLLFALLLAAGLHLIMLDLLPPQNLPPARSDKSLELTLISGAAPAVQPVTPATPSEVVAPSTTPPSTPKAVLPAPEHTEDTAPKVPAIPVRVPAESPAAPKTAEAPEKKAIKPQNIKPTQTAPKPVKPKPAPAPQVPAETTLSSTNLLARSLSMARAIPEPGWQNPLNAPRVRRLSSDSRKHSPDESSYLMQWRQKVQRVGQLNYPESARREKLSGQLRMLVVLRSDGSLDYSEVLSSSGYLDLDRAALRIIDLAAPFQPFPVELRKTTDRLEIIRVWRFENNTVVY